MLGVALYGSVFVLPLYLVRTRGYNAAQIGAVLAWTGLPQLLLIPLVPRLMRAWDPRLVIATGFARFAASNFMNVGLTQNYAADQLLLPNIIRAIGQALVFAPLAAVASAGLDAPSAGSASALFNMSRNLGGAIGIAALQTFLTKREQFHSNVLSAAVSAFAPATQERLHLLEGYFLDHVALGQAEASHSAVIAIGRLVRSQAYLMGFADTFLALGILLLVALAVSLFLTRPTTVGGGLGH